MECKMIGKCINVQYIVIFFDIPDINKSNNLLFTKKHLTKYYTMLHYTVKPAHAVTSIKQSPVLKSHLFLVLS